MLLEQTADVASYEALNQPRSDPSPPNVKSRPIGLLTESQVASGIVESGLPALKAGRGLSLGTFEDFGDCL